MPARYSSCTVQHPGDAVPDRDPRRRLSRVCRPHARSACAIACGAEQSGEVAGRIDGEQAGALIVRSTRSRTWWRRPAPGSPCRTATPCLVPKSLRWRRLASRASIGLSGRTAERLRVGVRCGLRSRCGLGARHAGTAQPCRLRTRSFGHGVEPVARLVLDATYDMCLTAARINADRSGNRTVF